MVMDKDILEQRALDLQQAVEQSFMQYHQTLGRLEEVKHMLQQLDVQQLIDDNPGEVIKDKK
jgi:hypothetical protein